MRSSIIGQQSVSWNWYGGISSPLIYQLMRDSPLHLKSTNSLSQVLWFLPNSFWKLVWLHHVNWRTDRLGRTQHIPLRELEDPVGYSLYSTREMVVTGSMYIVGKQGWFFVRRKEEQLIDRSVNNYLVKMGRLLISCMCQKDQNCTTEMRNTKDNTKQEEYSYRDSWRVRGNYKRLWRVLHIYMGPKTSIKSLIAVVSE